MADEATAWDAIPLDDLTEEETPITYGVVKPGDAGEVDAANRLHIRSPRAANQNYRISRETVASYLEKARDAKFRQNHGWFSRVYDMAITTPRETGSPAIIG